MMRTLTTTEGEKIVILTGRAAELVIENFKRNPPPFAAEFYRPDIAYDPKTRMTEKVFDHTEAEIFDKLNREVVHYRKLNDAKDSICEQMTTEAERANEHVKLLQAQHRRELDSATGVIEHLREELVMTGDQLNALKAKKKPGPKPKMMLMPKIVPGPRLPVVASKNGTAKKKA